MGKQLTGMLLVMTGLFFSGLAAADGTVFDTAGHEKVSGIRIMVTPPKGFSAHEHMDGYVVQEFTRKNGELEENLMLQLLDVDEEDAKTGFALPGSPPAEERQQYWSRPMAFLPTATIQEIKDVTADGRPAVFMAVTMLPSAEDEMRYVRIQTLNIYDSGRMVMLTCSVSGPSSDKAAVDKLYADSAGMACQSFFDSVKLLPEKPGKN